VDFEAVIAKAKAAGCTVEHDGKGHRKITTPGGARISASSTPSDQRAGHRLRRDLRREGGVEIDSGKYTPTREEQQVNRFSLSVALRTENRSTRLIVSFNGVVYRGLHTAMQLDRETPIFSRLPEIRRGGPGMSQSNLWMQLLGCNLKTVQQTSYKCHRHGAAGEHWKFSLPRVGELEYEEEFCASKQVAELIQQGERWYLVVPLPGVNERERTSVHVARAAARAEAESEVETEMEIASAPEASTPCAPQANLGIPARLTIFPNDEFLEKDLPPLEFNSMADLRAFMELAKPFTKRS
jgi:hypothetical protein